MKEDMETNEKRMESKRMKDFLLNLYEEGKGILSSCSKEALCHKRTNDILTKADLTLNSFFVSSISNAYPEAEIIAEESENKELSSSLTFVVDPLDGTCNFARGIGLHGIQLAVFENGECRHSLIGLPEFNEVYYAEKGKGAYRNGERLHVDSSIPHEDGVLSISDFYQDNDEIDFPSQFLLLSSLQDKFLKTRLFGAACFDFASFAKNNSQCYLTYYRHLWDIAPGLLLSLEAGGVASKLDGSPYVYGGHALLLANNKKTLDLVINAAKPLLKGK